MKFTLSHLAEDPGGRVYPFLLCVDRSDFLEMYRTVPALCRSEFLALVQMYGHYFGAEASWCRAELEDAAALLRLAKDSRSLVLSIQGSGAHTRVVYDAE